MGTNRKMTGKVWEALPAMHPFSHRVRCSGCGFEYYVGSDGGFRHCPVCGLGDPEGQTNYDKLRGMSVDELASFLGYEYELPPWCGGAMCDAKCDVCVKRWLLAQEQ